MLEQFYIQKSTKHDIIKLGEIMKKYLGYFGILLIALLIVIIPFFLQNKKDYTRNLFYMNTYIEVKIKEQDPKVAEQALDEVEKIYQTYHQLTDRYDKNSELFQLNQGKIEQVDRILYDLIEKGINWDQVSKGKLNINIGTVIDIWKKYREEKQGVPTLQELENTGLHDIQNIVLKGNNTIENKGFNIDLGSIVKGYATEEAGKQLRKRGIKEFLINAGGNVIVGEKKNQEPYKVGVESPHKNGDLIAIVKGNNLAVVTSGGYERFYEYDGKKYHHIIDPDTLYPANLYQSVTIVGSDSGICDALSTILFLLPMEDGKSLLKKYQAEALWILNDDTIVKSEGFTQYE